MTDPQLIEIPTLTLNIPEATSTWAYAAYGSLLMEVVESELEDVPAELDNLWTQFASLHDRLWSVGFDLVTAMGYTNVLSSEKAKEVSYGRQLYRNHRTVLAESIRTRNLRMYLSTRLDIEKQRQLRHVQEQGLKMEYAKWMVEATTEAYNVAVREFNANISALEMEEQRWSAVIAINDVALKYLEKDLMDAKLASEYVKGAMRQQRALAGVMQAAADLQRVLAEIQLNDAKVQAAEIEVQRINIQALLVGTQVIEEQAQTLSLQVDAQVIRNEGQILNVLAAQNSQLAQQITNLSTVKTARDAMYVTTLADKQALLTQFTTAQQNLITANTAYALAQQALALTQNNTEVSKYTSDDTVEDARTTAGYMVEDSQFDAQNQIEDARSGAERSVDAARIAADGTTTTEQIHTTAQQAALQTDAEVKVKQAQLGAEIHNLIASAAYQAQLTSLESRNKIAMDSERLSADISMTIQRFVSEQYSQSSQADLSAQKMVSGWAIGQSVAKLKAVQDDVANQVKLADIGEDIAKARATAAAAIAKAKIKHYLTEYSS